MTVTSIDNRCLDGMQGSQTHTHTSWRKHKNMGDNTNSVNRWIISTFIVIIAMYVYSRWKLKRVVYFTVNHWATEVWLYAPRPLTLSPPWQLCTPHLLPRIINDDQMCPHLHALLLSVFPRQLRGGDLVTTAPEGHPVLFTGTWVQWRGGQRQSQSFYSGAARLNPVILLEWQWGKNDKYHNIHSRISNFWGPSACTWIYVILCL